MSMVNIPSLISSFHSSRVILYIYYLGILFFCYFLYYTRSYHLISYYLKLALVCSAVPPYHSCIGQTWLDVIASTLILLLLHVLPSIQPFKHSIKERDFSHLMWIHPFANANLLQFSLILLLLLPLHFLRLCWGISGFSSSFSRFLILLAVDLKNGCIVAVEYAFFFCRFVFGEL